MTLSGANINTYSTAQKLLTSQRYIYRFKYPDEGITKNKH